MSKALVFPEVFSSSSNTLHKTGIQNFQIPPASRHRFISDDVWKNKLWRTKKLEIRNLQKKQIKTQLSIFI